MISVDILAVGSWYQSAWISVDRKGPRTLTSDTQRDSERYHTLYILLRIGDDSWCSVLGPRPASPRNLTVRQMRTGLFISWLPPYDVMVPVQSYKVYYRTVGPWVPLTKDITGDTTFLWKTVSRGATYQFQVYSYSKLSQSEPSRAVTFSTMGMNCRSRRLGAIHVLCNAFFSGNLCYLLCYVTLACPLRWLLLIQTW